MILRSASRFLMVALVVPMVLANVGCSGDDSRGTSVRGPKNGAQKNQRDVQPQEAETLLWKKTFDEADSMFDQVWAKLQEKKEVEDISSPFSIVQEAIKATQAREENNTKIDCRDHQDGTEFLDFAGSTNVRIVQKVICVNKAPVKREVMRIQKVSGNGSKWQFKIHEMKKELGSVFLDRSGKKHVVCEATVAQDGIIETLNCQDAGRSFEGNRNEYTIFDQYRYRRSGSNRILSIEARIVNVSTHKEIKKAFNLNVKGDATLEITLPESDEPEIETIERLVPAPTETKETKEAKAEGQKDENGVPVAAPNTGVQPVAIEGKDAAKQPAASDKSKQVAKQTPEEVAAESEMDKVIAEYCTEEELAFVKKQVHTKAEIADSCAAGEVIRQEVDVDQLPSAR